MRWIFRVVTAVCALTIAAITTACGNPPAPETKRAVEDGSGAGLTPAAVDGPMPHGDHQPHYGGVVYMHGDIHFEVVLDRAGRHRIYFSDEVRADLPASVASSVTLTVTRPGWSAEAIVGHIDEQGEGWVADGAPVGAGDVTARVAFVLKDGTGEGKDNSYWIDVPFLPVTS